MIRETSLVNDLITVTIRSFVPPDALIVGFDLGKPFQLELPDKATLGELIKKLFSKNADQIGVIAVNGKLAAKNAILSGGDKVDLYELLGGG